MLQHTRGCGRFSRSAAVSYFDYEEVAREARIPAEKLEGLHHLIREEFPRDEMMYELHLLRA